MRSMFHLIAWASMVSPLWNSAPRRSLKVQVFRSAEASHSVAMAGDRLHLGIEVEQTAGERGQRLRDEVDEVAMGIEADGIVAHPEAQRAAAFGVSLAPPPLRAASPPSRRLPAPSRSLRNSRRVRSVPFLPSPVMDEASLTVFIGGRILAKCQTDRMFGSPLNGCVAARLRSVDARPLEDRAYVRDARAANGLSTARIERVSPGSATRHKLPIVSSPGV